MQRTSAHSRQTGSENHKCRSSTQAYGKRGKESLENPEVPNFNKIPAKVTEGANKVGASWQRHQSRGRRSLGDKETTGMHERMPSV